MTLLDWLQLHPNDKEAWKEFVDRYSPTIFHWARRLHLSEEDANDLVQDVFKKLHEKGLKTFRRENRRSAKPWLRQITHRTVIDWIERRAGKQQAETEYALGRLHDACSDLDRLLDEEFDLEQLESVLESLRGSSRDETWKCFELRWLGEKSVAEVAEQLGISAEAARKNCYRMFLRVAKLLRAPEDDPTPAPA